MSVREDQKRGKDRVVVDRRWPDSRRFRRFMPNRATANKLNEQIGVAIANGSWRELRKELDHGTRSDLSVSDYADRYLEVYCKVQNRDWKRKESSLKHIKRLLGKLLLPDVELKRVYEFVAARLREEVKHATVNRDVAILKHMFEFAVEEGSLKHNPIAKMRKLKEYREERPRVSEQQIQHILDDLTFPVKQIVQFIVETGCRPSEALALKREHVDLEKRTAIFNMRKAGDNALVALTSRAAQAVEEVPELPGCPYVFWNPKTRDRYQKINNTFERAREKAGLPGIQLKDFRRELGTFIAESGQPLHVAQTQLGHSSIRTTEQYYARYSPEFAISRAREVLEKRFDGRQTGDRDPNPGPVKNSPKRRSGKVLDFQEIKKRLGGAERIRTAE